VTVEQRIEAAGTWFLDSGIRFPHGGVARLYRSDLQQNASVSTEITGYAASILLAMYRDSADPRFLAAAESAIDFLIHTAWHKKLEAMPFEHGNGLCPAYFFDTGIVARALLAGFRLTKNERYREAARACCDSMARDFDNGSGFNPVIELPTKRPPTADESRWSLAPGCYQLKAALAWRELWEATGESKYHDLYHTVLEYSLITHVRFLPGSPHEDKIMDRLHAYCYFLEGLLPVAGQLRCADVLRAGVERVARFAERIGPRFLRADVLAQLLCLRLLAGRMGVLALDRQAASAELQAVESFQCLDPAPRRYGGFWFGRKAGTVLPYLNPVTTALSVEALLLGKGPARAN